mgnify:CR=1 FL=1
MSTTLATSPRLMGRSLATVDPEIAAAVEAEFARQRDGLELIASENYASRAVLEAMATGVPVVVTDIPSLRELPCGSTLRVAVGDARGLAQGARDLLLDPARWREQRSRGLAAAKAFSVSRAVDVVESVLASL